MVNNTNPNLCPYTFYTFTAHVRPNKSPKIWIFLEHPGWNRRNRIAVDVNCFQSGQWVPNAYIKEQYWYEPEGLKSFIIESVVKYRRDDGYKHCFCCDQLAADRQFLFEKSPKSEIMFISLYIPLICCNIALLCSYLVVNALVYCCANEFLPDYEGFQYQCHSNPLQTKTVYIECLTS